MGGEDVDDTIQPSDVGLSMRMGSGGVSALAAADVIIVVDVFSFTTCVDVAVSQGAAILPYAWGDDSAAEFARLHGAELAGKRRKTRYSLAPESYLDAPVGLRCVLPSPNGARITLAAAGPRFDGVAFVALSLA